MYTPVNPNFEIEYTLFFFFFFFFFFKLRYDCVNFPRYFKVKRYIVWGDISVNIEFEPFWNGVYCIRKEFAPSGSKFFPIE